MVLAQVTSAANKLGHKKQNAQSLVTACFLATFELCVCNNDAIRVPADDACGGNGEER